MVITIVTMRNSLAYDTGLTGIRFAVYPHIDDFVVYST